MAHLKSFGTAAAMALSVLGASTSAHAQAASCAGYSDCLLVYDANGALVAADSIWVTESQENANGASFIYSSPVATDGSQFGNATVLQEPGVDVSQGYSDIFGIASTGGGLFLSFASDTDTSLVNFGQFPMTFLETPAPFSATLYLDPGLQAAGWTATFQSDAVPEPSTWALLMIGFAGLGYAGFRRANSRPAIA